MTTRKLRRVCVFCGSRTGQDPRFRQLTEELGRTLAARNIGLVYGGGSIGLMGVLADAVLQQGGHVIVVIPESLAKREVMHADVSELRVVDSMHTRKALMAELSDAFIALPGGYGTFEELFEVITWAQLGIHTKPLAFLNVAGFYDGLFGFLEHAIEAGFIKGNDRQLILRGDHPEEVLERLEQAVMPSVPRWTTLDKT